MKRIAYFTHTGNLSGPNNSLLLLLQSIDRTQFDPVVYFPSQGDAMEEFIATGESCRVIPMTPMQKDFRYFPRYLADMVKVTGSLRRAFKTDRIDAIHINTSVTPYPGIAARTMGIPVLWHIRENFKHDVLHTNYLKLITTLAQKIVAVSNYVYRNTIERIRISPDKLEVVLNGIDLEWFDRSSSLGKTKKDLGLMEGRKLVALPAFILPHKGHKVLLEATSILVHKIGLKNICIVFIGNEAEEDNDQFTAILKSYCQKNGLNEYVKFLGLRRDIPALLTKCDIVCLPATYDDPLPRVVLEGMAAGKPVVGTLAGGIPEMVADGRTGLLVPRGRADALASALADLIKDEDKATRMGREGRLRVETEFTSKIYAQHMQSVYNQIFSVNN